MYAPFFGLQQEAFSIAPDPRFLHLSAGHREALAHLLYGLQGGGGFVLLTGEIGTGKTTVCRCFLEQIPAGHRVAYVYNPKLTPVELLQTVCQEFGITVGEPPPATGKPYVDALNRFLLDAHARGEHCLLVVDEAQALSARLLELLRLLTNLETSERKLLQIVLIGQPELRAQLAQPELVQLSQRIIARVHLGPLSAAETADYVRHRLSVAGLQGPLPFDARALAWVHRLSGGVPRRINLLCQRALLGAYAQDSRQVHAATVRRAAHEAFDTRPALPRRGLALALACGLLVAAGAATVWWWQHGGRGGGAAASAAASAASMASAAATPGSGAVAAAAAPVLAKTLQPFADDAAATAALAAAWGLAAEPGADTCRSARGLGLACHEGRADIALLRRLDRPLLLTLAAGGAVLLRTMGADTATLQGAGGEQRVALATLQAAWDGAFLAWWRPPPGDTSVWVLTQLTALQGPDTAAGARAPADEALRRRVFAFQVGQGLPLDGLAGPLTLMQLNRASGIEEPRLRPEP
jgi:general secretion pathway protein A